MENPSFHLEGIVRERNSLQDFEGPLNLILLLLQKNKIQIRDLSISDILEQYLQYLDRMQEMDLEIASEFVQMASHLLYLKTKTLLTSEEGVSELEILMQSLEQLQARDRFAAMAVVIPQLREASERGKLYFTKLPEPIRQAREYGYRHDPVDLLKAMLSVWTRGGSTVPASEERIIAAMPRRIVYSVREKGREILLSLRDGPRALNSIYSRCDTRSELVATFVAVLELCSVGSLHMENIEGQVVLSFSGMASEIDELVERIEDE